MEGEVAGEQPRDLGRLLHLCGDAQRGAGLEPTAATWDWRSPAGVEEAARAPAPVKSDERSKGVTAEFAGLATNFPLSVFVAGKGEVTSNTCGNQMRRLMHARIRRVSDAHRQSRNGLCVRRLDWLQTRHCDDL